MVHDPAVGRRRLIPVSADRRAAGYTCATLAAPAPTVPASDNDTPRPLPVPPRDAGKPGPPSAEPAPRPVRLPVWKCVRCGARKRLRRPGRD